MNYIVLDADRRKANIEVDSSLLDKDIIMVLVEVDTEKDISDIASIVTQNASKLHEAHQKQDRIAEIEILGDDDLLGMQEISKEELNTSYSFTMSGVHKIDRYEYRVNISVR